MEVLQIVPCNMEMYAQYEIDIEDDDGSIMGKTTYNHPVIGFALCADGCVYPMVLNADGIEIECGQTSNFIKFEIGEYSNNHILRITSALLNIESGIRNLLFK